MEKEFFKYNSIEKHECIPNARGLIFSLRSMGYTVETAISDLIDNAIAADADVVDIYFDWSNKKLYVLDNGMGMEKEELISAMDLAEGASFQLRDDKNLGRFGMGMKTASFSMAKNLLVISKKEDSISNMFWDIDYVMESQKWHTLSLGYDDIVSILDNLPQYIKDKFKGTGTLLVLSKLDKLIDENNIEKSKKAFYEIIENTKKHISLYFHRFIEEDGLEIYVNGNKLEAWNPFLSMNNATQELPVEEYDFNGKKVVIEPYILPHESKFDTKSEFEEAGRGDWNKYQGFYVYRNRRLIKYGTWFKRLKKESGYRLARIKLDITTESDEDWKIDIRKSKVTLPSYLRDIIIRISLEAAEKSVKIYNSRGTYKPRKKDDKISDLTYVWEQRKNRNGQYSFYLNKRHPLLKKLEENLDDESSELLKSYLRLVENYMPAMMSGIIQNSSGNKLKSVNNELKELDIMDIKGCVLNFRRAGIGDAEIISLLKGMKQYSYLSSEFENIVMEVEHE